MSRLVPAAGIPSCPHHRRVSQSWIQRELLPVPWRSQVRGKDAKPALSPGCLSGNAAPTGSGKQQQAPLQGQGPALPARIHPHSPAMSAASPLLGTARAALPAPNPGASSVPASRHTGSPRAARTLPWSLLNPPLEHGKGQRGPGLEPPELPGQLQSCSRADLCGPALLGTPRRDAALHSPSSSQAPREQAGSLESLPALRHPCGSQAEHRSASTAPRCRAEP